MENQIALSKESAIYGMEEFLKAFSYVPDDKLNWSPSSTAKTPMQIAAHAAVSTGNFAKFMRERKIPFGDEIPEFLTKNNAAEKALKSRVDIEHLFRKNMEAVIAALDTLTVADFDINFDTSLGWSFTMTRMMNMPGIHALSHTAQIEYLQTCWGDLEMHFFKK